MHLLVPRTMGSLEALVPFVRQFLAREGLPESMGFDLDLVIEELFTNLVRHGKSGRNEVDVSLERRPPDVVLCIREFDADHFDPTTLPPVDTGRPIEEREPGGLGVHFVRVLSRTFQYDWSERTGTTTVTMGTEG
jgi:serine/threonine-protein kinase RsbW